MSRAEWAQWVQGLGSIFVALVVGLIAAWIAYQQWRVGRAKFKLDLFDKRYEVYLTVWTYLTFIADEPSPALEKIRAELNNAIPKARFLFDAEIEQFANECQTRGIAMRRAYVAMKQANDDSKREALSKAYQDEDKWMRGQLLTLKDRFSKYLAFDGWH